VTISGSVSLILAKECNNGLDQITNKYVINGTYSNCVTTALKHYLFCEPWEISSDTCTNPIQPIERFLSFLVTYIHNSNDTSLLYLLPILEGGIITLVDLDSCNDTIAVYGESKQNICYNVNNAIIQISLLYIIQSPILIVLLIYILFGWYRLHFQRVPYVIHTKSIELSPSGILSNEELDTFVPSDNEQPEEGDNVLLDNNEPLIPSPPNPNQDQNMEELKATLKKNLRTVIFTGFLFTVVFLMIFIWFGFLGKAFSPYRQLC